MGYKSPKIILLLRSNKNILKESVLEISENDWNNIWESRSPTVAWIFLQEHNTIFQKSRGFQGQDECVGSQLQIIFIILGLPSVILSHWQGDCQRNKEHFLEQKLFPLFSLSTWEQFQANSRLMQDECLLRSTFGCVQGSHHKGVAAGKPTIKGWWLDCNCQWHTVDCLENLAFSIWSIY